MPHLTENMKGTLDKVYYLKQSDLESIDKLIKAQDVDELLNVDNVDVQISMASYWLVGLKDSQLVVGILDRLIDSGAEYSDSYIESNIREQLFTVAAELDEHSIGSLLPLFKSFDLNSDESYFIKNERVRKAVKKVFLEILTIKRQTYSQAKIDYLSEHPLCKFYPIESDGINGITIDNFWPEEPTTLPKQSESKEPEQLPWTFNRIAKVSTCTIILGFLWRGILTDGMAEMGILAPMMGVLLTVVVLNLFELWRL